jgi:hypothetical protein
MMLGYHTVGNLTCSVPEHFAYLMLGCFPYGRLLPLPIAYAWLNAVHDNYPSGVPAVMGPIGLNGVEDINDCYPGIGSMGPSIPPAQITGWWYINSNTGLRTPLAR